MKEFKNVYYELCKFYFYLELEILDWKDIL